VSDNVNEANEEEFADEETSEPLILENTMLLVPSFNDTTDFGGENLRYDASGSLQEELGNVRVTQLTTRARFSSEVHRLDILFSERIP
jgi:hypothetical protein